jgi:hypothetical protein
LRRRWPGPERLATRFIGARQRDGGAAGFAMHHFLKALAPLAFACAALAAEKSAVLSPDLATSLAHWRVEQMPGGSVTLRDGALVIEDAAGCTVWLDQKLTAPVEISYDVTVVARGGAHDRVSDVNCFWMAADPKQPERMPAGRSGKFEDYDSLRTYYVGMGGNENTTTRFRRYAGDGTKPLLPAFDLQDKKSLLEPNRTYHLRVIARDGTAEFWRDGERVFSFRDIAPFTSGWFALRTVKSHLEIRHLRVTRPD